MSNIWISGATPPHVPGPQPQTIVESQKAQIASYAVTVLSYVVNVNTQTLAESQKAEFTYAVTGLSYS